MDEQSQKDEMRAAVRGDRQRALERWREQGRAPVFVSDEQSPPVEPEPEVEPEPQAQAELEPAVAERPQPEPEAAAAPEPEPLPEPGFGVRLLRLLGRRGSAPE